MIKNLLKNLSVSKKVLLIVLLNAPLLIMLGAVSYFGTEKSDQIKNQIVENNAAEVNQLKIAKMHDALRADVYNALLTDSADTENKNKVGADFASHVETCKTSLDLLTKSNVNSHIKLQAEKLRGSLNAYITSSSEIIKTTFDGTVNYNSIFGKQKLAAYQIVFNNIAVELDTLTKMIEQESLSANQQSSYAADNVKIILIILTRWVKLK